MRYKNITLLILISGLLACLQIAGCNESRNEKFSRAFYTMGSSLEIKLYAENERIFNSVVEKSIKRTSEIDLMFSNYRDDSVLAAVNREAGSAPVKVPQEFADLTSLSIKYSELTAGAFDITIGNLFELWKRKVREEELPSKQELNRALECTGYTRIRIKNSKVSFPGDCFQIDFGAIGKGYVVDEIHDIAKSEGIKKGLINFGGNIYALDSPDDSKFWEVGINNPANPGELLTSIGLNNYAVATSGDYEKYFEINGKRYSHIIKPLTGMPADNTPSVTVAARTATEADVLSTAFSVMGLEKTKHFMKGRKDIAVLYVVKNGAEAQIYRSPLFIQFEKNVNN